MLFLISVHKILIFLHKTGIFSLQKFKILKLEEFQTIAIDMKETVH